MLSDIASKMQHDEYLVIQVEKLTYFLYVLVYVLIAPVWIKIH